MVAPSGGNFLKMMGSCVFVESQKSPYDFSRYPFMFFFPSSPHLCVNFSPLFQGCHLYLPRPYLSHLIWRDTKHISFFHPSSLWQFFSPFLIASVSCWCFCSFFFLVAPSDLVLRLCCYFFGGLSWTKMEFLMLRLKVEWACLMVLSVKICREVIPGAIDTLLVLPLDGSSLLNGFGCRFQPIQPVSIKQKTDIFKFS